MVGASEAGPIAKMFAKLNGSRAYLMTKSIHCWQTISLEIATSDLAEPRERALKSVPRGTGGQEGRKE